MYEKFTNSARDTMKAANQVAIDLRYEYVDTEHLLLGLIRVGIERFLNTSTQHLKDDLLKHMTPGLTQSPVSLGKRPQTPRVKKVIEYAIRSAREMNSDYVGTGHLLLGILLEGTNPAAAILKNRGVCVQDVYNLVEVDCKSSKSSKPSKPSAFFTETLSKKVEDLLTYKLEGWVGIIESGGYKLKVDLTMVDRP